MDSAKLQSNRCYFSDLATASSQQLRACMNGTIGSNPKMSSFKFLFWFWKKKMKKRKRIPWPWLLNPARCICGFWSSCYIQFEAPTDLSWWKKKNYLLRQHSDYLLDILLGQNLHVLHWSTGTSKKVTNNNFFYWEKEKKRAHSSPLNKDSLQIQEWCEGKPKR